MATRQTKSFITLCILAILLTYVSIVVAKRLPNNTAKDLPAPAVHTETPKASEPKSVVIDSSTWTTYTDPSYPISFKYPSDWNVKANPPTETFGWYTIMVGPKGETTNTINIYINPKDYYALDGVKTTKTKIGAYDALAVQGSLYGIKQGKYVYTFDAGTDTSLIPYFTELMKTISLK